jgi:hypothetical protein
MSEKKFVSKINKVYYKYNNIYKHHSPTAMLNAYGEGQISVTKFLVGLSRKTRCSVRSLM